MYRQVLELLSDGSCSLNASNMLPRHNIKIHFKMLFIDVLGASNTMTRHDGIKPKLYGCVIWTGMSNLSRYSIGIEGISSFMRLTFDNNRMIKGGINLIYRFKINLPLMSSLRKLGLHNCS